MKSPTKNRAPQRPVETPQNPAADLTPRLVKRRQGEYVQAELAKGQGSEVIPVGRFVLVKMDTAAEVTSGGIALTASQVERDTMASESGLVVEIADGAFRTNADGTAYVGRKPVPGDRVFVEKYAGSILTVDDGTVYRLMADTCIHGIYIPPRSADA